MADIPDIIRFASILSVILPLGLYFAKIKYASRAIHSIGGIAIVSAISDLTAYLLYDKGESTIVLFNLYYVILFLLLTWFYYEILSHRAVFVGLVIYLLSWVLVTLYVQAFSEYQTFMWTIAGVIMIIYSISYFIHLFSFPTTTNNLGLLWINSGVLFYFSFTLFLFIMSSYVLTRLEPEIGLLIWSFHNVNNIIKNVLFAFGISSYGKQRTDQVT